MYIANYNKASIYFIDRLHSGLFNTYSQTVFSCGMSDLMILHCVDLLPEAHLLGNVWIIIICYEHMG